MIHNGWMNFGITFALCAVLVVLVVHYYRPKRKEDADKVENPKYRMLEDDDEK